MVAHASPDATSPDEASDGGAFERSLARRDEVRARLMNAIPWWYVPWGHLAATVGIGLVVLWVAATHVHGLHLAELLVVPATMLTSNLSEWHAHKKLLHRRSWPLRILYDRHTPEHHVVYVENDMAIRSFREFRLVLIPAAGVLTIVVTTAPFAIILARVFSANVGWLFLVTSAFMMVSYELLHLSYHLSPKGIIGGSWLISTLRRHHARHHDPRLMQRWNFNVTVPLFDWVFGTIHKR
jgi:hypothetical protein